MTTFTINEQSQLWHWQALGGGCLYCRATRQSMTSWLARTGRVLGRRLHVAASKGKL
jgi:hypothetical protein